MRNIKKKKSPREITKETSNLLIAQMLNIPMSNFFDDFFIISSVILKFCKLNEFSYESGYSSLKKCFIAKLYKNNSLYIYEFKDFQKESAALTMALSFVLKEMSLAKEEVIWKQ